MIFSKCWSLILSPWEMCNSILEVVVVWSLDACWLQHFIPNTAWSLTKTVKKTSPKTTCFLMLIFSGFGMHFGSFWEALGPPWGQLGECSFFVRFGHFGNQNWNFHQFGIFWGAFWEGLGRILAGFEIIWKEFCDDFLEVWGNTSLVFGNGS